MRESSGKPCITTKADSTPGKSLTLSRPPGIETIRDSAATGSGIVSGMKASSRPSHPTGHLIRPAVADHLLTNRAPRSVNDEHASRHESRQKYRQLSGSWAGSPRLDDGCCVTSGGPV